MARPNVLVTGEEQNWYTPTEFRQATIDPTARGENASLFGSNSVVNPMSWGNMLSEQVQQPEVSPADIMEYEKDLQQTEATKQYYNAIDALNNLAVQARKSGFDINRPDPLNPNQRILNQEYLKKKQEAARIGTLAKQGFQVQQNLPTTTKDRFIQGNPNYQDPNTGFYQAERVSRLNKNELHPEVEAFNKQVDDAYLNTDKIPQIKAQQEYLINKYNTLAAQAPTENERLFYKMQSDAIDRYGRKIDYTPQKLSNERERIRRSGSGGDENAADANIVLTSVIQMKNGTFQNTRPNELGQHIYDVNPIRFDNEKQPTIQQVPDGYGGFTNKIIEDPDNIIQNIVREPNGEIYVVLQSGRKQPVSDFKLAELTSRSLGLGQKGFEAANKLASTRQAITQSGYDTPKIRGEEAERILKPLEDKYNRVLNKPLTDYVNDYPELKVTLTEASFVKDALDNGLDFTRIPVEYGGQPNVRRLFDLAAQEREQAKNDLQEAQRIITSDVRFDKSLADQKTANTVRPQSQKMITVTLNGKQGQIPESQIEAFKKKYPKAIIK